MYQKSQYKTFLTTLQHIKYNQIKNIPFIYYVKSQINRACELKQITIDERRILLNYFKDICYFNGIKI